MYARYRQKITYVPYVGHGITLYRNRIETCSTTADFLLHSKVPVVCVIKVQRFIAGVKLVDDLVSWHAGCGFIPAGVATAAEEVINIHMAKSLAGRATSAGGRRAVIEWSPDAA